VTVSEKITKIDKGYDAGLSLPLIITSVGTDDETLRLIHSRLGTSMKTLRWWRHTLATPKRAS
jgi:hypothetical protein